MAARVKAGWIDLHLPETVPVVESRRNCSLNFLEASNLQQGSLCQKHRIQRWIYE